jgi:hypothetical protein
MSSGFEVPDLPQLDAAAVAAETQVQDPRDGDVFALASHLRPPLDSGAIAGDDGRAELQPELLLPARRAVQ